MADDAATQARIAALAGAINRHKQQQPESAAQHPQPHQPHSPYGWAGAGQPYRGNHYDNRWAPFPPAQRGRGRGRGRGAYAPGYQNRTLVNTTVPSASNNPTPQQQLQNMQNRQERAQLTQHFSTPGATRELEIEGVRFSMKEDGSKLTRLSETSVKTPKKAVVAGVEFFRTKNGNLLRSATINAAAKPAPKPVAQCEHFIKNGIISNHLFQPSRQTGLLCQLACSVGTCPFGDKCRFGHDPDKVSMCKTFFRTGACANDTTCDLSHKPTYNRVPACTHFQNGNCTNNACRYAHVSPSPGPLICRPFALLGYCDKGVECDKRHVIECPDYAENGDCPNQKCKLPHTRHAHAERQKARTDDNSEFEDDDEEDVKDIDSDDLNEDIATSGGGGLEIAQNRDFISFS